MEQFAGTVLGVVVILAGFFAYMRSQFVDKDLAAERNDNTNKKLDEITNKLDRLGESALVRNTVNETLNQLAEMYNEVRLSARGRDN